MANEKEVKLVIAARNAASKAIDAVVGSLTDLNDATKGAAQAGKNMDSVLGQLGAEFTKLNREVAGLTALGKVTDQLNKAEGAVKRLETANRQNAAEFARVARESKAAADNTARLKGEAEALANAYGVQRKAVADARKEQTAANKEVDKAVTAQARVANAAKKFKSASPWSNAADSAMVFADAAVKTAQRDAAQATATHNRLKTELADLAARQKQVSAETQAATTIERQYARETEAAATATRNSASSLKEARDGLEGIRQVAAEAGASLGRAALGQKELQEATDKANAALARSRAVVEAISRYSTGGSGFAAPKLAQAQQAQRAEMEKTYATWKTLEAEAGRLARAIASTTAPTEEQVRAFNTVTGAARAAKDEFNTLQAALAKLQGSGNGSFAALDQIDGGLRKIVANKNDLEQTKAVLEAMSRFSTGAGGFTDPKSADRIRAQRAEVDKARQAYELLDGHARRLAASMSATVSPTRAQAQALQQAQAAARAASLEYQKQVQALNEIPGAAGRGAGGFSLFASDGRKALSLVQRLRGEVLSLATAYLGLYQAISQVQGVIAAYQKLEAAQSRLGAVFKQNQAATRTELLWLERQASRLGIEFGTLTDEYSKFAVAANAANYETASTRKIFLSLAEAGRVNKLTTDQMSGSFLALQQMISKGKVSSEELRRQLGDRLPGAFNIFADALGVTTAQLDKMLQQGEVFSTEETLLKFADALNQRFGPQLQSSLQTTTTLIGQFWNEIFQAQLRVGEGGFIESFNRLLRDMIGYFRSREGRDFFLSVGSALGTATDFLRLFVQNISFVIEAVKLLLAYKFAGWILAGATAITTQLLPAIRATQAGLTGVAASAGAATAGVGVLTGAMRALAVTMMRIPQLALVTAAVWAVSEVIGSWVGGVEDTTSALDEHKRVMGEVLTAYEQVGKKTDDWGKAVKNVTLDQANASVRKLRSAFDEMKNDVTGGALGVVVPWKFWQEGAGDAARDLNKLNAAFYNNRIDLEAFKKGLEDIYKGTTSDAARQFIEQQLQIVRKMEEVQKATKEAETVAKAMGSTMDGLTGTTKEATGQLGRLANGVENAGDQFAKGQSAITAYKDAIDELKGSIPDLKEELETLKDEKAIEEAYKRAIDSLDKASAAGAPVLLRDYVSATALRDRALNVTRGEDEPTAFKEIAENTGLTVDAVKQLAGREGFRAQAYRNSPNDPWTVGYGHTSAAGGMQVDANTTVTRKQALEQLGKDVEMFADQVDDLVKVPLTESMRSALVSLQYNSGGLGAEDGRRLILDPLNAGNYDQAAIGITQFRTRTKDGVDLSARRKAESDEFVRMGFDNAEIEAARLEREEKITEQREKQAAKTRETIVELESEIRQLDLKEQGLKREAEIEKAIAAAKKENPNITEAEIARVTELTGKVYDLNQQLTEEKRNRKEIRQIEQEIGNLDAARNSLLQQRQIYESRGDQGAVDQTNIKLQAVNTQLQEAIDKAIAMWQAIGGTGADAAILKLETLRLELDNFQKKQIFTAQAINQTFSGALVGAFDQFAQAVANGENVLSSFGQAFLKFASDFLIQIAQMILQQAIFNSLFGGSSGGGVGGFLFQLGSSMMMFHDGGVVGQDGTARMASPSWFNNAVRYHEGGIAGLKPGEMPAILEKGEEVLTANDPRHVANGGGAGRAPAPQVRIINSFDSADVVSNGLSTPAGEDAIINVIRSNAGTIREIVGG